MIRACQLSVLCVAMLCLSSIAGAEENSAQLPQVITLTDGWRFRLDEVGGEQRIDLDDQDWQDVRVPHSSRDLTKDSSKTERAVWLRRVIDLPTLPSGTRVVLQITKIAEGQCWLNGELAAPPNPDESSLVADITEHVRDGRNQLALRMILPGIPGEVRLHILPEVHLGPRGLMVDTADWAGGPAQVRIRTEVENHSESPQTVQLQARVFDPTGKNIATAKSEPQMVAAGKQSPVTLQSSSVSEPPLWSPQTPQLCRVVVELTRDGTVVERQDATFGFRWIRFEPDGPLLLNGEPCPLRGVVFVRPSKRPFPDQASRWQYEVDLLKGMGINFVRISRETDASFLDACDRAGLMASEQIFYLRPDGASASDIESRLRDVYNHPSIIAWMTNGEGKNTAVAQGISEAARIVRTKDGTRPVLCCELGWRSPGTVGLIDADVAGQGNYTGWYEGTLDHIGPYLDDYRALLRERYGRAWPIVVSNYGAASDNDIHTDSPRRNDYSHEYHTDFHQRFYKEMAQRPWLAGGIIFCFRDANSNQPIPRHTWKGVVDLQDRKKDAYYFYQSRWTTDPMVHIAQKDWSPRNVWPAESDRQIEVFSNCERVELFHNGTSLGTKTEEENRFVWDVSFQEGPNSLRAVACNASACVEDNAEIVVQSQPPATQLRLVESKANGGAVQLAWDEIVGADEYRVYSGTKPGFDVQDSRPVATVGNTSVKVAAQTEPQFYKVVAVVGGVPGPASVAVGIQPGGLQWKFANSGWLLSSPALADLTGDRQLEIVIGSYNGSIYALGADGKQLWSFDATDPVLASPAVAALAQGEPPSIVVNSTKALFVLSNDGKLKWRHDGVRQFDRSIRSPTLVDLDGDNRLEIVVGSDTGKLMAFDADGQLLWEYSTAKSNNRGLNPTTCVAIDLDDGTGTGLLFSTDNGVLYLLDANGKEIWTRDLGIGASAVGTPPNQLTPAAGRLHDAGPIRIFVNGQSLTALDTAGNLVWERADVRATPQVSNLFRDGDRQIVASGGNKISVLDHHGQDLWSFTLPNKRDYVQQPPVCADLDEDGEPDLVVGTRSTNLVAISSRGKLLWTFNTEDEITGSPAVADINKDGIVDVIFGSRDGYLYVLSGGKAAPDAQESLGYRGGNTRTAAYGPNKLATFGQIEPTANVRYIEDVAYGPDPLQNIDAYLPASDRPTPVLVEFHGGGWRRGHKRQNGSYKGLLEKALGSGIAVVSSNYRLTPKSVWPAQGEDAARVVQFVRSKAAEWNLDPDRIVLVGGSAGAHLSLWVGLHDDMAKPDSSDPVERQSTRVSGIIDCWGPADLSRMELEGRSRDALPQLFGCTPEEWDTPRIQAMIRDASPSSFVSSDDPPVLAIHTEAEMDLPASPDWKTSNGHSGLFGLQLQQQLAAVGVDAEVFFDADQAKDPSDHPEWVDRAFHFLKDSLNVK